MLNPMSNLRRSAFPLLIAVAMGVVLAMGADGTAYAGDKTPKPPASAPEKPTAAVEPTAGAAQADREEVAPTLEEVHQQLGLTPQQGIVTLGPNLATLDTSKEWLFYPPKDAGKIVYELWGNPRREDPLGVLLPAANPFSDESWGVVITYADEGHVDDADAAEIDYTQLMAEMQADDDESNAARQKAGFPTVTTIGWAEPPRYDATSKKLYWAQELAFAGTPEHTLNYAIRVLGRQGVLELNAVGVMSQLPTVKAPMEALLQRVEFRAGNLYSDFNPDIDKVAAVGIAGLIAGKVAAKAGFFKVLIAALIAGKKLIAVAALVVVGFFAKFFRKGKTTD